MKVFTLFFRYIGWHYSQALVDLWNQAKNYIWFVVNFFSIPILLRTFFAPWKRLYEEKTVKKFDIENFFERTVINTLMRLFGVVCRSGIILAGVVATLITIVCFLFFFIVWVLLPIFIVSLLVKGVTTILYG